MLLLLQFKTLVDARRLYVVTRNELFVIYWLKSSAFHFYILTCFPFVPQTARAWLRCANAWRFRELSKSRNGGGFGCRGDAGGAVQEGGKSCDFFINFIFSLTHILSSLSLSSPLSLSSFLISIYSLVIFISLMLVNRNLHSGWGVPLFFLISCSYCNEKKKRIHHSLSLSHFYHSFTFIHHPFLSISDMCVYMDIFYIHVYIYVENKVHPCLMLPTIDQHLRFLYL